MKNENVETVDAVVEEVSQLVEESTTEKEKQKNNPLKIIKLDPTKRLDLTKYDPVQVEKAKEISKALVAEDTNSILNYGVELQSKLSTYSTEVLNNVRNIDTGEMGDVVQDLLSELNMIKVEDTRNPVMRAVSNLPVIKNLVNKTKKMLIKYDKVSDNLDNIVVKIDQGRVSLLKDIKLLDTMFDKNVEYIEDLESYILAARIKIDEMEQKIAEMEASDNIEPFEVQDAKGFLDRLRKKLTDLQLTKEVTVQTLPQIRVIQGNNSIMVEKIQSAVTNTIPIWRNHICMAITIDKQKRIVDIQKKINETTNEIILKNSEKLKENSVNVARLNEESIVDIETLKKVNQDLISTLDEIVKIKKEGDMKRAVIEKELEIIDKEIKEKVMETQKLISNKK